ncbi:unnamed protein product [Meganyctiphanes norvegica]|uniref:CUB domain-containing protein n=1 Tax=Meganyctiphanes norvegica TaxID=48144 RepID=A0AAV2RPL3_MEGNR
MQNSMMLACVVLSLSVGLAAARFPFLRQLETLPCDSVTTMNPGERVAVQTPNFPSNYPTSSRCQWEITCNTKETTTLRYICPAFELESSSGCANDRLIVTQQGNRDELCGTDSPDGTVTSTGWTRLTFVSNAQTTAKGFRCFLWCDENPTTTTATTTTTTTATTTTPTTTTPTTTTPTTTTTTPTTTTPTTTTPITTTPTTTTQTTTTPTTTTPTTTAPTTTTMATTTPITTAPTTTTPITTTPTTTPTTTTTTTTTAPTTTAETTTEATTPDC